MIALAIPHSLAYRVSPRRSHGSTDLSPTTTGWASTITTSNTGHCGSGVIHWSNYSTATTDIAEALLGGCAHAISAHDRKDTRRLFVLSKGPIWFTSLL